jgi:hypothetical protein
VKRRRRKENDLFEFKIQVIGVAPKKRKNSQDLKKSKASDPYHTATTNYPCCVPALGEFIRSWLYGTCLTVAKLSEIVESSNFLSMVIDK